MKRLKRENAELKRANSILKAAAAYVGNRWAVSSGGLVESVEQPGCKGLRRVTLCPWRIGNIVRAPLVILQMQRGRW